jgi:inorganic phosphate transporter, PiT family
LNDALLVAVVVIGLGFDFTNGFQDTANAIATSVSTRALSPRVAVIMAATLNLAGAFLTTAVAKTVGKGIIETGLANEQTVLAALLGAVCWNLVVWRLGLPSSSTHALVGGLVGAALVQSGSRGVAWHGLVHKVVFPALASPAIGFAVSFALLIGIYRIFHRARPDVANRGFRSMQIISGAFVAFVHGANDSQKTMGVLTLALVESGHLSHFVVPVWVKVAAGLAIGLGTYAGGWRVIRTVGQRLYKIEPPSGCAAQAAAGAVLYTATHFGFPVSTTHTVSGAVMGAGATRRLSAVRWGVAGNIVAAWLLTIPCAAAVSAAVYYPVHWIF